MDRLTEWKEQLIPFLEEQAAAMRKELKETIRQKQYETLPADIAASRYVCTQLNDLIHHLEIQILRLKRFNVAPRDVIAALREGQNRLQLIMEQLEASRRRSRPGEIWDVPEFDPNTGRRRT